MNAFESLVALLLSRQGYWTHPTFKVELTKDEKRQIGRPSSPRWEIDVVAYKGSTNEVLAVECKSYLDSPGVLFRDGMLQPPHRYKLFAESKLRQIVLGRLAKQLKGSGSCGPDLTVRLCLAAGRVARRSDRQGLEAHFRSNGWPLFDEAWIRGELEAASGAAYENDVAVVVAKLLLRES